MICLILILIYHFVHIIAWMSQLFFLFRPKPNTAYVVCLVHRIIKWLHLFFQQQKVETLNFNFRFTLFCFVFYLYKSGRLTGMEQKLEGMHICQFNCMSKEWYIEMNNMIVSFLYILKCVLWNSRQRTTKGVSILIFFIWI